MKKKVAIRLFTGLFCLALSAPAWAISYTETFLGGDDSFLMVEKEFVHATNQAGDTAGFRARFNFRLDATGGRALLFDFVDDAAVQVRSELPTTDVSVPELAGTMFSDAFLDFAFSANDEELEQIRVNVVIPGEDPNVTVFDEIVNLDSTVGSGIFALTIDLKELGLLDELNDGRISSVVLAPAAGSITNTFTIEEASLTASVPEPGTILLLGSGLIGFAGLRRKFHL